MTPQERLALAILRGGRSFGEAGEVAGLPADHVMRLWREANPSDDKTHEGLQLSGGEN